MNGALDAVVEVHLLRVVDSEQRLDGERFDPAHEGENEEERGFGGRRKTELVKRLVLDGVIIRNVRIQRKKREVKR